MYLSELSQLTLVIPTYNRQKYALRSMRYWSGRGPTVYVMDGSAEPIDSFQLAGLASNIHYIHSSTGIVNRILLASKLIKTKYAAMIGDDEFFLPAGLTKCIQFLEAHSDYVACSGLTFLFSYVKNLMVGKQNYSIQTGYEIDQATPEERLRAHFGNYTPSSVSAVTRADVWSKAVELFAAREFAVFAITELEFEFFVSFAGKSKVLSELMWLRSSENRPIRGTDASLVTTNQFRTWWNLEDARAEKNEFIDIVVSKLASLAKQNEWDYSKSELKEMVIATFDIYVEEQQKKIDLAESRSKARLSREDSNHKNLARLNKVSEPRYSFSVKKLIDLLIKKCFKQLAKPVDQRVSSPVKGPILLVDAVKSLSQDGMQADFDEVKEIIDIVIEFHNTENQLANA